MEMESWSCWGLLFWVMLLVPQSPAELGRTPMVSSLCGYRVDPTANHRETQKPTKIPENAP